MTVPHGPYLAVRDESGMLSFVIYPRPEGDKPSLMPAAAFRRVRTLELRPSTPGWPWVAGRDDPEPIFPAPGRYTIVLSENLESHGYPQHRCTVEYVERGRD